MSHQRSVASVSFFRSSRVRASAFGIGIEIEIEIEIDIEIDIEISNRLSMEVANGKNGKWVYRRLRHLERRGRGCLSVQKSKLGIEKVEKGL